MPTLARIVLSVIAIYCSLAIETVLLGAINARVLLTILLLCPLLLAIWSGRDVSLQRRVAAAMIGFAAAFASQFGILLSAVGADTVSQGFGSIVFDGMLIAVILVVCWVTRGLLKSQGDWTA